MHLFAPPCQRATPRGRAQRPRRRTRPCGPGARPGRRRDRTGPIAHDGRTRSTIRVDYLERRRAGSHRQSRVSPSEPAVVAGIELRSRTTVPRTSQTVPATRRRPRRRRGATPTTANLVVTGRRLPGRGHRLPAQAGDESRPTSAATRRTHPVSRERSYSSKCHPTTGPPSSL
jgi:hypothetical protein